MPVRCAVAVNDDHLSALCQCRPHTPQKRVWLFDFMIHMDHENPVEAVLWKAGIIYRTFLNRNIVELLPGDALPQTIQRAAINVLRQYAALGANPLGKPYGVISLARTNIGHGCAKLNTCPFHNEFGLAGFVTCGFGGKLCVASRRYTAFGTREVL